MKKKILSILAVFAVLGIFSLIVGEIGNSGKDGKKTATPSDSSEEEAFTDGYSYAEVEKWVSYLAPTDEKKKELGRLVDPLTKSNFITMEYVTKVVEITGAPKEVYLSVTGTMPLEDYVTREQFDQIYNNMVTYGAVDTLTRENILVYHVSEYVSQEGIASTQVFDGQEYHDLLTDLPEEYSNKVIDVYMCEGYIYRINGLSDEVKIFPNALLISVDDTNCTFLYNGMKKTYSISSVNSNSDATINVEKNDVVKITVDNTGIIGIESYKDTVRCRVYDIGNGVLELVNQGNIAYSEDIKIYDVSDEENPLCEDSLFVLKGHPEVLIVRDNGVIIGAVIEDELVTEDIRVILSNNNYSSYKLSEVSLVCDTAYKIEYSDYSEANRSAGKTTTFKYGDYEEGTVITVTPEEDGFIQVLSLERACGNPVYEGTIEIRILEDGMHIINEVSLETYLYSVVASEMPTGSNPEALKAMAICARGYAYTKMKDGSFDTYNADLDDSSLCQVYNNVAPTPESMKAVKDTYGLVPIYDGALIVPLYFSTSCGMTCTNDEIWGGSAYSYLTSNVETVNKENIDLSDEENFIQFIKDSGGYDIIDKDMPYYRWEVSFSKEEISEAINSMLEKRLSVAPEFIKTVDEDGELHSTDISDIGQIRSIQVIERTKSGVVSILEIEGTLATIQVSGQTNIRNIITPVNQEIIRQDGNVVTGWTSLPSPFYYIEQSGDEFTIHGGGFGHGVGMSQSGAQILAEQGYNYKYILRHYYSYIDFSSIYIIESKKDEE